MNGHVEAWSFLDNVPLDRLILDPDLASQCFIYNLGNLNIDRCRVLYNQFREHYNGTDLFRAIQFAEPYLTGTEGIIPVYHAFSAKQIDSLPLGAVTKAMILVQNSAALLEKTEYEEAEKCVRHALRSAGGNILVSFFALNQMAQVFEETGRLNESLSVFFKSGELFDSSPMLNGIGANYYFGAAGVYMRRMELDEAEKPFVRKPPVKAPSAADCAQASFTRDLIAVCGGSSPAGPENQVLLSTREREVLGELAKGITNRDIAAKLFISQATVKTHILSIFGKLGVSSRLMAVQAARKNGLLR